VGARTHRECEDQGGQCESGRERFREQRDGRVSLRQPRAHDAGADNRGEQQGGADRLGERRPHATGVSRPTFPMSSRLFCSVDQIVAWRGNSDAVPDSRARI